MKEKRQGGWEHIWLREQRRESVYSGLISAIAGIMLLLVVIVPVALVWLTAHDYVITDGSRYEVVRMHPGSVSEACEKAGFQGLTIAGLREESRTTYITLDHQMSAQIVTADQSFLVWFTACTVGELLEQNGVDYGADDIITPDLDEWLTEDTEVKVVRVTYETDSVVEAIPFEIETIETDTLPKGEQRIVQYGASGEKETVFNVTLHDGVEASREVMRERVRTVPRSCRIQQGTAEPEVREIATPDDVQQPVNATSASAYAAGQAGDTTALSTAGRSQVWSVPAGIRDDTVNKVITAGDGSSFSYSSVINVKATAYHRVEEGGLITATGTTTRYGTVAVDPRVIPLGSRVYVVSEGGDRSWSYGPGLAEDTGGLIKGSRVDLFFMTGEEAEDFGVRAAKVYILED